jgi:hypothetical protein
MLMLLMTQGRAGPGFVPRLRRSDLFGIDPQPFRAGLGLAAGPPGLASVAILECHFPLTCHWQVVSSHGTPGQAG